MGTQIFIKSDGCKVEYTKINAHSFSMSPIINNGESPSPVLYYGGKNGPEGQATWSRNFYIK
jgi:hypothetical protein